MGKHGQDLDIDIIAPQHGAIIEGRERVNRFIGWIDSIDCGLDLMGDTYEVPG